MKTKKIIFYILMFLPLIVTLFALPHLPAQIPAHYNAQNQVTRWGSKYETLIFPAMSILLGLIMLAVAKYSARQEGTGKNNETICIIAGILSLILFNAMTYYFLYTDFHMVEDLSTITLDINQLLFGILGIFLIVAGNLMPKVRKNSLLGLRTSWSQKNEITWKKSQRFGGISLMIGGILMIIVCLLTKGYTCFLWSMGIFLLILVIDIYMTYKIAQKN